MAYQVKAARDKEKELHARLSEYKIEVVESLTPEEINEFKKAVAQIYTDNQAEFGELFKQFGYNQ